MLREYAELIRINQWYKNLLVFLPIVFSKNIFNLELFFLNVIGFFCLCFVSSSNYIINNLIDIERDRYHPEKHKRVIIIEKMGFFNSLLFSVLLFLIGILIAYLLDFDFFLLVLTLFTVSQLYNFIFKNELFLDVITISVNFVLRAVSGAFITNVVPSYWLIIGVFFLAFFICISKRYAEMIYLQKNAGNHKQVLNKYDEDMIIFCMIISTALLMLSYVLYSFLGEHENLFLTIPFAIYGILRYAFLTFNCSIVSRNPEKVFTDGRMLISMSLYLAISLFIIYY